MIKIKLTFVDIFSFSVDQKTIFVNEDQFKQIEKNLYKIVHQEFKNSIKYIYTLDKIEIIK